MRMVFCKTQFEGFHYWDDAPDSEKYLCSIHRHMFHVKVSVQVFHEDREIEFISLKHRIESFFSTFNKQDVGSCEAIATILKVYVSEVFPKRFVEVEVSEDNENGAIDNTRLD